MAMSGIYVEVCQVKYIPKYLSEQHLEKAKKYPTPRLQLGLDGGTAERRRVQDAHETSRSNRKALAQQRSSNKKQSTLKTKTKTKI